MGWDFCDNWKTVGDVETAELKQLASLGYNVVAHARGRGNLWFSIERNGLRHIEVTLVEKDAIDGVYGCKRMSEHEHPYCYDVPAEVLDTVKDYPPTNEGSKAWRERVRVYMDRTQQSYRLPGRHS